MTETLRMLKKSRSDLHGYLFTDAAHAREWLRQSFVNRNDITLEPIEHHTACCPRCRGRGIIETIRPTGGPRMTVGEFLGDAG